MKCPICEGELEKVKEFDSDLGKIEVAVCKNCGFLARFVKKKSEEDKE
jgi:C4-type Zn-finger protein